MIIIEYSQLCQVISFNSYKEEHTSMASTREGFKKSRSDTRILGKTSSQSLPMSQLCL